MAKSEYRNPKQIRMIQLQNLKQHACDALELSNIPISDLLFVSNLSHVIRHSSLM
jgi:hypothetical protein